MANNNIISLYPSAEQKEQIETQADKHDESLSQYCLEAVEQRIAREVRDETAADASVEERVAGLVSDVQRDVESVIDPTPDQELLYEIALWELLSSEYSKEDQEKALKSAANKFEKELENLAAKRGED